MASCDNVTALDTPATRTQSPTPPVSEQQSNRQQPFLREREGKCTKMKTAKVGRLVECGPHCNPGTMLPVADYVVVNS